MFILGDSLKNHLHQAKWLCQHIEDKGARTMHVMEYCCIIATHVLRYAFNNIALPLFHCRDYLHKLQCSLSCNFPMFFNKGVNLAKIAQIRLAA